MSLTLVLGGARSGKSRFAQMQAERQVGPLVMIATGQAFDEEMRQRIDRHRAERGPAWHTVEAPVDLLRALAGLQPSDVAVVDCLTLWLNNLMFAEMDLEAKGSALVAAVQRLQNQVWLVSNEVGLGIVPENALARRFRDSAGRLHQQLAAVADRVVLMVAGLPMIVK
ncbi:adenosylcobinamide kinase/adenosylcobinamide phosphate guanyltransferase [Acidocella aquatica]|uniref:Bifunctional adenosylcobalamin biosynthesis protein n=1 Tax=Acidocella aquatica TaxID=1922313 RepID=A0ABQ6A1U8_9PROT|nr:bifunctional adenosylcobinamide kinase/adenosylcobinamide-phosphate guanylyltransferase [Acidocella aquatica]GLR65368.1 adenosylcobinamide kinase/adenosylcobinamide phosphate guanyltransferase [Acidocella aquatica]